MARSAASAGESGDAVSHELHDPGVVADDDPTKMPFVAQDARNEPSIRVHGHAVERVERRHDRHRAGVDRGLERRQVHVAQRGVRDVGGVVVPATFRRAVRDEVFGGGDDARVGPLEPFDPSGGEHGAEIRIFAGAFDYASPSGIARDVDHGRVRPLDAIVGDFDGGDARRAFGRIGIPTRGFGERHGEDGAIPMDRVVGEEERDVEPRLGDGDALQVARRGETAHAIEETDASHADGRVAAGAGGGTGEGAFAADEIELSGFLLERHAREDGVDEPRDGWALLRLGDARSERQSQYRPTHARKKTRPRAARYLAVNTARSASRRSRMV